MKGFTKKGMLNALDEQIAKYNRISLDEASKEYTIFPYKGSSKSHRIGMVNRFSKCALCAFGKNVLEKNSMMFSESSCQFCPTYIVTNLTCSFQLTFTALDRAETPEVFMERVKIRIKELKRIKKEIRSTPFETITARLR